MYPEDLVYIFDMTKNIQGGGGGIINSDAMRQLVGQQVQ